jgi:membrane protein
MLAGNLAFRLSFAAFPSLIAILWLLRAVHADELGRATADVLGTVVPGIAHAPLKEQAGQSPALDRHLSLGIAVSIGVSLWAISEAFRATIAALNRINGAEEQRQVVARVVITVAAAAVALGCFGVAMAVIVSGTRLTWAVAQSIGLTPAYHWLSELIAWLVVIVFVWAAFTLTYEVGPARNRPFRLVRSGSLLAVTLWVLFTIAFAIYAAHFADPRGTYGALAGVAFLMIYSYGSAFALLMGAVLDREVLPSG